MIPYSAKMHGAFFVLLLDAVKSPISVQTLTSVGSGCYLLEQRIPVFLKLSNKRRGPWTFNFQLNHQHNIQALANLYGECLICLICGQDGIVGFDAAELRALLGNEVSEQGYVTVRRRLHAMYQLKGIGGCLSYRIGRRSIFQRIKMEINRPV
jgi:hypothetical protein